MKRSGFFSGFLLALLLWLGYSANATINPVDRNHLIIVNASDQPVRRPFRVSVHGRKIFENDEYPWSSGRAEVFNIEAAWLDEIALDLPGPDGPRRRMIRNGGGRYGHILVIKLLENDVDVGWCREATWTCSFPRSGFEED